MTVSKGTAHMEVLHEDTALVIAAKTEVCRSTQFTLRHAMYGVRAANVAPPGGEHGCGAVVVVVVVVMAGGQRE